MEDKKKKSPLQYKYDQLKNLKHELQIENDKLKAEMASMRNKSNQMGKTIDTLTADLSAMARTIRIVGQGDACRYG